MIDYLKPAQEHGYQFSVDNRKRAEMVAQIETLRTGIPHQTFVCTTYRDLRPHVCIAVIPELEWVDGELVTRPLYIRC